MAVHCVAAEHSGLIKKKRKESSKAFPTDVGRPKTKKESSWVKLKAFPTNVGRPNNPRPTESQTGKHMY